MNWYRSSHWPVSFHARFSRLTTTCVCASRVRTTWSASPCCASTARPRSSPRPPSCSGPSTPSRAYAAAARWASRVITARRRSTCVTPTPAWTEGCVPAEREATPVSAVKTTLVSDDWSVCSGGGVFMCVCVLSSYKLSWFDWLCVGRHEGLLTGGFMC